MMDGQEEVWQRGVDNKFRWDSATFGIQDCHNGQDNFEDRLDNQKERVGK